MSNNYKLKVLTTDTSILKRIKLLQFKRQILPIVCIVLSLIFNMLIKIVAFQVLPVLAFGWYLAERIMFRTKEKIGVPQGDLFLAPVEGRVISKVKSGDSELLTIKKTVLDTAELRLPYSGLHSEQTDTWQFDTPQGSFVVKVKAPRVMYFPVEDKPGNVAGVIPGKGIVTVRYPGHLQLLINEGDNVWAGETPLFDLGGEVQTEPAPRESIIVE